MAAFPQRHDLLHKRLERFTRFLPGVEQGDIDALHRARVASRRLRELLPILQLEHGEAAKLGRRLRKIRTRLGTVRELGVMLILIDELHETRRQDRSALKRVSDSVRHDHAQARQKLVGKRLPMSELKGIARKLSRLLDTMDTQDEQERGRRGSPAPRGWRWALEARIAHRAEKLGTAIDDAGAVYLPERLHVVRLGVKKLRYALELFAEANGLADSADLQIGRAHV